LPSHDEVLEDVHHFNSLMPASRSLFGRKYWRRVRVQQQFAASPNLSIQCGKFKTSALKLQGWALCHGPVLTEVISILTNRLIEVYRSSPAEKWAHIQAWNKANNGEEDQDADLDADLED